MAKNNYFIGVGNETQSTKTITIDGDSGSVPRKATEGYGLMDGLPLGHNEQDPSLWIDALHRTIRDALREVKIELKNDTDEGKATRIVKLGGTFKMFESVLVSYLSSAPSETR